MHGPTTRVRAATVVFTISFKMADLTNAPKWRLVESEEREREKKQKKKKKKNVRKNQKKSKKKKGEEKRSIQNSIYGSKKKKRKALDLEILHRVPRLRAFRKRHFFVPMRRFFVEKKD